MTAALADTPPDAARYTRVAVVFHWLIAALIIGELAGGKIMTAMGPTTLKFELYQWHKSFGLLILALSLARLLWRLGHRPPPLPATMARWERLASHATHTAFYVFMIGVPLLGWAMVSASNAGAPSGGVPTLLFGVVPVPDLPVTADWAKGTNRAHAALATAFGLLIVVHVAAALRHHFVLRDTVLMRMAPWVGRR